MVALYFFVRARPCFMRGIFRVPKNGMRKTNKRKRSIAGTYPFYPNFFIITSTSWKIRAKNPNIREVDYGNTTCYSEKAVRDLDCDYSGMQEQRYENKGLAC